ncbi:calpain-13 [Grus japonensis]|uniref:Calpain-13 n=1 Tax=Grus japonensis TaxID=30415 RepID=A0ABC9WQP9_GRUJA
MESLQNLKKFNNQDFNHLRALCLSQGLLFEDDTFPAHVNSIGPNLLPKDKLHQIQWKRPTFWQYGDWVDVVIDDRLPFLNGRYLSVHPRTSNEFWPSLLEKAYAKLRGSYQNLHGGYLSDALVDLTGGVQVQFSLKDPPPDLEQILKAAAKSQCLMGCSTSGQLRRNIELKNGIVQGHAYTITGTVKIPYKNGWKHIIRIWNPWGHGEWKGPWSDGTSNVPPSPELPMDSAIDASQLQQLLNEVFLQGLAADEQLLRLMVLRYGDAARRIGFTDFVCCMLRLETMTCESRRWGLGWAGELAAGELAKPD